MEKNIDNFFSANNVKWKSQQVEYHEHFCKEGYVCFSVDDYKKQHYLQKPENNFYFAGEHTSKKFASMNGAIESGLIAAQQIIQQNIAQSH